MKNANLGDCFSYADHLSISADRLGKKLNADIEWTLDDDSFKRSQLSYGPSASAEHHKMKSHVSYFSDNNAYMVNVISFQQKGLQYIFPPFSLLGPVI